MVSRVPDVIGRSVPGSTQIVISSLLEQAAPGHRSVVLDTFRCRSGKESAFLTNGAGGNLSAVIQHQDVFNHSDTPLTFFNFQRHIPPDARFQPLQGRPVVGAVAGAGDGLGHVCSIAGHRAGELERGLVLQKPQQVGTVGVSR